MTAERKALAGAASDGSVVGPHPVTCRWSARPRSGTAFGKMGVDQCLSRMQGNLPVRF
jgi:hypothetical protein